MILRFLALFLITISTPATAQENVKPLSEILNPSAEFDNGGEPITSSVMANEHYKTCVAEVSLVLNKEEQTTLCACQSANMAQHLSVEEFKILDAKSKAGRDARGKAIAFGFTPCMNFVIDTKVQRQCLQSKRIKNIIFGKKKICDCTVDYFKDFISRDGTRIIMEATKNEPMNLNPLEYYLKQESFFSQVEHFVKLCNERVKYER